MCSAFNALIQSIKFRNVLPSDWKLSGQGFDVTSHLGGKSWHPFTGGMQVFRRASTSPRFLWWEMSLSLDNP